MKQFIASLGNQTINGTLATLLAALYVLAIKTLRAFAWVCATGFVSFAFVCFWMGAKEFFHRLPTSIEIIKTFF